MIYITSSHFTLSTVIYNLVVLDVHIQRSGSDCYDSNSEVTKLKLFPADFALFRLLY